MARAFLNGSFYGQEEMDVVQLIERTITEVDIPEGVTVIGKAAFMGCKSITQIDIPEGIMSIGEQGFRGCSKLEVINLPQSLTSLGREAVMDCYKLKKLVVPPKVTEILPTLASSCQAMTEVVFQGNVLKINGYSFQHCTSCKKYDFTHCTSVPWLVQTTTFLGIPDDCKILVPAALYDAWIVATNWSQYADHIEGVERIPMMVIPDHVSEGLLIEGSSVMGRGSCTDSIVVINEDETVTSISGFAFSQDEIIEEVYILGSIEVVDGLTFGGDNLKRMYMENVRTVYGCAVRCSALEYVRFSKNIRYIDQGSFVSKNENVIFDFSNFEGEEIPGLNYGEGEFRSLSPGKIVVPASRYEEWKSATNWSHYADNIVAAE